MVVVTFIPQVSLWMQRGRDWQGSYAYTDPDELAYSAYVNALIEGNPRGTNPYLGNGSGRAFGENFYSIQFLPAYAVALGARLTGVSASTAFILLIPIMAFASSLAIFWLLVEVTGDAVLAAIGVLLVLLCGLLVSEYPFLALNGYRTFAFLRRYIPAVPFPLFFIFCVFVWRAFTRQGKLALMSSFAAGVTIGLLAYSYFYLWTAGIAWLLCFTTVWIVARPADLVNVAKSLSVFGAVALSSIVPYLYMLANRTDTMDQAQALVSTHAPDVLRFVEVIGACLLIALVLGVRRGFIGWRDPVVLFAASFAATPFVVFNQQIITGRSLQSFHYEQFVINYQILVGLVVTYKLVWSHLRIRPFMWIALAVIVGVATGLEISFVESDGNRLRDEAIPVFKRIQEHTSADPAGRVALFDNPLLAASAPTNSSFAVLWSPYLYTFGTPTTAENIERFHQYLYYLGVDEKRFAKMLKEEPLPRAAIFGLHRVNSTLTIKFNPVSAEDIRAEVQSYSDYIMGFSQERASRWPLSHVVLVDGRFYDLSNLDRWYERDGGERIGGSLLYGVRLRRENQH